MELIRAINACNPLIPSNSEPICRVYIVSEERNQVATFLANYGLLHADGLVEVDYSFVAMRDLFDNDLGWSPHIPALHVDPKFGNDEVIQGPKPKKRKREIIEEKDNEEIIKLKERVMYLENLVDHQLSLMGSKGDAFRGIADPVFSCKDAQLSKGICIEEPVPNATISRTSSKAQACAPKDKGKGKLIDVSPTKYAPGVLANIATSSTGHVVQTTSPKDSFSNIIPSAPAKNLIERSRKGFSHCFFRSFSSECSSGFIASFCSPGFFIGDL